MSMTIGRFSTSEDPDAGTLRQRGDEVSFSSMVIGADVDEMKARVQQLRGLMNNPDEDTFPFTWSEDSSFDGFYTDFDVEVEDSAVMLTTGVAPFRVRMRRVGGAGMPSFETLTQTVLRTNSHAIAGVDGILTSWAVGSGYTSEADLAATLTYLIAEDGNNAALSFAICPQAAATYQAFVKPADFYKAGSAVKLELKYGSSWYPVHGQQVPAAIGTNWRISNGMERLYPSAVGGAGRWTQDRYESGAWKTGREFGLLSDATTFEALTTNAAGDASFISVLANRPELVVVRVKQAIGAAGTVTVDFSMRRGDQWAEVAVTELASGTAKAWGIGNSSVIASTAITAGARATADDANGLRYGITCPATISTDLVNGRVYLTSAARSAQFQVGADYTVQGTISDSAWRGAFFSARSESQRVVVR